MPLGIRITRTQLHRGFAELDPFPDDRCIKFVVAAQGSFLRRTIGYCVLTLSFVVTAAAFVLLAVFIVEQSLSPAGAPGGRRDDTAAVIAAGVAVLGLFAAGLIVLVVRDVLLTRRIRYVLRMRSRCFGCGYGLLGLALSPSSTVKCPECGVETKVDPSLAQLTRDESGVARLQDVERVLPVPVFWTPARRRLRRGVLITLCTVFVLLCGAATAWEIRARRTAARARALMPTQAQIDQIQLKYQLIPVTSQNNAWTALLNASELITAVHDAFKAQHGGTWPSPYGDDPYVEPSYYTNQDWRINPLNPDGTKTREALCRELAQAIVPEYVNAGLPDRVREAVKLPAVMPVVRVPSTWGFFAFDGSDIERFYNLAMITRLCMLNAQDAGDDAALLGHADLLLGIARVSKHASSQTAHARFAFIEQAALEALRQRLDTLEASPLADRAAFAKQVLAVLDRRPPTDLAVTFEMTRIACLRSICNAFEEPSTTRLGPWSPFAREMKTFNGTPFDVGTLQRNLDALEHLHSAFSRTTADLAHDPIATVQTAPFMNRGFPARILRSYNDVLTAERRVRITRIALETQVRITLFEASYQRLPASLDEVTAFDKRPIPRDVFSPGPVIYRVVDPAKDINSGRFYGQPASAQRFVIYLPGPDTIDNLGTMPLSQRAAGQATFAPPEYMLVRSGEDVVLNAPIPPRR